MAKVQNTVIDVQSEPVLPGSSPKPKGRGRPAGSGTRTQTETSSYSGDYAASKQQFNSFDEFLQWVRKYPDKRGLSLYLYRLEPVINLSLIGQKNSYIDLWADVDVVTRESIQQAHGGGKFKLMLSDSNRGGGAQQMATTYLDIDTALAAPVLNPLSLVLDDPRKNQGYIQSQILAGVLVRDDSGRVKVRTEATMESVLDAVKAATQPNAAAPPLSGGHGGQASFTEQLALKLIDRVSGAAPVVNPGETIQQALLLADRLHPQNPLNEKLLAVMVDRLMVPPAPAPVAAAAVPDMFDQYEKVESILEKLGAGRGAVAANASGFQQAMGFMTELLKAVPMGFQIFQGIQAQRAATGLAPLPGPGPVRGPIPMPGPIAVYPSAQAPGAVAFEGGPVEGITDMPNWMNPAFQGRLIATGERAIGAFQRGVSGYDFAVGLCSFEPDGVSIYEALDSLGAGMILSTLGSVPQCAALLADATAKAKLEAWIADFLTFDPKAQAEEPGAAA